MTRCHTGKIIYPAICGKFTYMYIIVVEDPCKHLCKPHGAPFQFIQICCYHLLHASRDRRTIFFCYLICEKMLRIRTLEVEEQMCTIC